MDSKKILVTGGGGFIGRNVVEELLVRGYEVHSLVNKTFLPERENLFQHQLDLLDASAVNKFLSENHFENLIHLAWYVGKGCHSSANNMDWLVASLQLLTFFHQNGGRKFLGAGSVSEYDYHYGLLREDTPTISKTLYGQSKNSLYRVAEVFCKQKEIDFKWVRIFNLYGPNEKSKRLIPCVMRSCLNNENVNVSEGLNYLDYLHVEDTAAAIADVFESSLNGAVNICSAQPIQVREIVTKIVELTEYKGEILWGSIDAAFEDNFVVGNNDKLKSIGWKQKYSLDAGLKMTLQWWKENDNEVKNDVQ